MTLFTPREFCEGEIERIVSDMSTFLTDTNLINKNQILYYIACAVFVLMILFMIYAEFKEHSRLGTKLGNAMNIITGFKSSIFITFMFVVLLCSPPNDSNVNRFKKVLSYDSVAQKIVINNVKNNKYKVILDDSVTNAQQFLDILMLERAQDLSMVPREYVDLLKSELNLDSVVILNEWKLR